MTDRSDTAAFPTPSPDPATGETTGGTDTPDLSGPRADRSAVLSAMHRLEAACDHAATQRGPEWCAEVAEALATLVAALETEHLHADAASGLWAELVAHAPRLARRVERLRADMTELRDDVRSLQDTLKCAPAPTPAEIDGLRVRIGDLLGRLRLLRAREADLIHEAWVVDIGGGD